ncbi:MAG TPA: carbohydrate kinase [Cyanobacteria bacterium UBA11371]|nr:carbohydrate kinase [Cyanobacteria bacterium UBA11371]HBE30202.1 carbohydrate kinase [Cyanobacteria bacterium UBA11368]
MNLYLGIDFGTSGARAIAIDSEGIIQAEAQYPFAAPDQTIIWQNALFNLLEQITQKIRGEIKAIALNGTSSTVLLCDSFGNPISAPLMYNDGSGIEAIEKVKAISPPNHTVLSATSSLAKLFWLIQNADNIQNCYFLHQADWLAFLLHGCLGISDYHNALKLGYDVGNLCYPNWLENLPERHLLPQILAPGTPVGEVRAEIASRFNLRRDCLVCTGTTDSIAAFLASGANSPGEAVTSLGSTLALKLLSRTRVDDSRYGIYSHRLPPLVKGEQGEIDLWLVGGASNTGGAVLKQFFTNAELENLSSQIDAEQESLLDYYPLVKAGDRFPINDPNLPPRLQPRPENPVQFLHGLLESIARIEALGYQLLQQFGATPLTRVYTAGGGAKNPAWQKIRQRHLQVSILRPIHTQAAYGSALLAMQAIKPSNP